MVYGISYTVCIKALKGFLYPYFEGYASTIMILGPFGFGPFVGFRQNGTTLERVSGPCTLLGLE